MSANEERIDAQRTADAARARLTATMVDLQARVNPRALARDALEEVRDVGLELANGLLASAKRNPMPLIGIGATIIALFARDWIADALGGLRHAATEGDDPRSTDEPMITPQQGPAND